MNPTSHAAPRHGRRPDIYLVGTGILGVWQLTREAEACLAESRKVFLVDATYGVAEHIESLGAEVINLLPEYVEGGSRIDTYRTMAARALDAALDTPPVSLAVYGHPSLLVYPTSLVRKAARHLGLVVHTVPGISSIDTMLIDLDLDPGLNGLQIYEANTLIVEDRPIDVEVPCLLLQVDAIETAFHTANPSRPSRFRRLVDHLLRFYPPEQEVINVRSSSFPIFAPELISFPLSELGEQFATKHLGGTVYIPKLHEPSYAEDLVRNIFDPLHLNRITLPLG
jgi:uncharacterized protein YabN with tetrapyrrole methylase and pyrophosphatase domain